MERENSPVILLRSKDVILNLDPRKVIIVIFIIALPLLSINMQREPGESPWYLKPFSLTVSAMHYSYASFSSMVKGTTRMYLDLWGIKRRILELEKNNNELKARLNTLNEIELENKRLRKLIDFKEKSPMELVPAQVIGRDITSDRDTIYIDRGLSNGLKAGQAVISVEGTVGYIFRPSLFTSQVLLITDRYTVIDSAVQRSRARGIVEGTNKGTCKLRYLERADDVQIGDLVVTSGLDNLFPKGFPVGLVTKVKKHRYGISQEVEVQPVVNSNRLEEVFVILASDKSAPSIAKKESR